jgi:competence protein ComEA
MAQTKGGKGVNLNKATVEELEKISGLGKKRAQDLIDYRNQHGPFKAWEDLQDISGFSKKMIEDLKNQGLMIR